MFDLDVVTNENNAEHNSKWLYNPDDPYRLLIIGGSGSRKTNALLNLIREQDSDVLIDKIYLYAKELNEPNHELLIKKCEEAGMYLNDPNSKAFIEYSITTDDFYSNINGYNPRTSRKNLIVFDNMIDKRN